MLYTRVIFLLLIVLSPVLKAEVVDKAELGFHIKVTLEINASHTDVYDQFLKVHEWWDGDHSWFGKADGFYIEPRAGGCFCEKADGKRSVLHMLVSYVDPGSEIKLLGGLGPLQGLGLHGAMSFKFEPISKDKTRLIHEYRVTGYTKGGLLKLADAVDAVQTLQVKRLQARFQ